jgi:DNA-binding CsgD family transcriptional regulator
MTRSTGSVERGSCAGAQARVSKKMELSAREVICLKAISLGELQS